MLDKIQEQILSCIKQSPDAAHNPMKYVREAIGGYAIEQLNKSIASCSCCKAKCKTRTLATGNPNASLLVIMDYPTESQAGFGKPIPLFAGNEKIERFLRSCFEEFHVDFDQILFMNTVNCCPSRTVNMADGTTKELYRTPLPGEIQACQTFVRYAVDVIHPPMMILMGGVASSVYIPQKSISKIRGTWQWVHCIPAMPTYSPHEIKDYRAISIEKSNAMLGEFKRDISCALSLYQKQWPNSNLFVRKGR